MKIFVLLICVVSLALAEPPVGDGYPSARSSDEHSHDHDHEHHHGNNFQRSLSQEYGTPAARSIGAPHNTLSTEYGPPSTRTTNPGSSLSQTYGPPNVQNEISQEYGEPNARSLAQYSSSKSLSTEYGLPDAHSGPSEWNSASIARSGLSQEYGVPSVKPNTARSQSGQYGATELRTPSDEYGTPSQRSFSGAPSQKYGPPAARNSQLSSQPSATSGDLSQRYTSPRSFAKSFATSSPRSSKGSAFGARSSSTSHEAPARSSSSYSANPKSLTKTYGAPNQRDISDTYEVPSTRDLSQEYGVPASHAANQKTSAFSSTNSAVARSDPSDTYGAPSARDSMPSEQYGVPDQYSNHPNQGYSYARGALDETLNQEPASYDFAYKVNDYESGSDFGHTETRQDNRAEGSYFVVLPDGTKQVVEYEADERGFKSRISVEPANLGRSGGYDDNAAELARSGDGPY